MRFRKNIMPTINKNKNISKVLLDKVEFWLKENGVKHFSDILEKHGKIDAVWMDGPIPHPVHFREGMQVRNFLRDQEECASWDDEDFDNNWVAVIEKILKRRVK